MPVIPADPISPVVIVLSIVILAVALGLFVMVLKDESASPDSPATRRIWALGRSAGGTGHMCIGIG